MAIRTLHEKISRKPNCNSFMFDNFFPSQKYGVLFIQLKNLYKKFMNMS